jgi:hypothetical protein
LPNLTFCWHVSCIILQAKFGIVNRKVHLCIIVFKYVLCLSVESLSCENVNVLCVFVSAAILGGKKRSKSSPGLQKF